MKTLIISSAYCVQHQHGCLVCRSLDCRSSFRVWRCTAEPQQLSALDESGVKRSTPRYQTMQAKQGNRAPLTCPSMVFRLEDGDLNSPQRGDILSEVSPSAFSPATAPLRRLWDGVGRKIKGNFVPRSGSFKLLLGKPWDRQLEPSVIVDRQNALECGQSIAASLGPCAPSDTDPIHLLVTAMHPRLHRPVFRRQLLSHRRGMPVSSLSRQFPPATPHLHS